MANVCEQLKRTIEQLKFEKTFMFDDINGERLTYNDYFSKCLSISTFLEKENPKKVVVAVLENSIELSMLYFVAMLSNITIIVIDPQKGVGEIEEALKGVTDAKLFCSQTLKYKGKEKLEEVNFNIFSEIKENIGNIKQLFINKINKRDFEAPYLVTFTSGTTGVTKGVVHSLNSLFQTAYALNEKVEIQPDMRILHVMPMTYMAGILNSIFYPFIAGASIVITKRFSITSARFFWKKVIKYHVNLFWLSPAMLMMIEQLDRGTEGENYCKNNEVVFFIGTADLTDNLRKKFNDRYGVKVFASYGLSETLFISVETEKTLIAEMSGSVGEILNGVEYTFTSEGELLLFVPWMYLGYTNENTKKYFQGKYYKSGDLAIIEDNQLFIVGRCKDIIVRGGMNISPALLEKCISEMSGISECAVFGVKDRTEEEKICCAYVVSKEFQDNINILEAQMKKLILNKLGKNYTIDYFWKVISLTRNINGKIDKNQMKYTWEQENG